MEPNAYLEMAATEARHWWFVGRRAILAALLNRLGLPPNAAILEIGAGTGGNLEMLSNFGEVSALEMDAAARGIAATKHQGRYEIHAGCCPHDIPFQPGSFALVCLFDVLEHIDADVETLVAAKDLLGNDGKLLLTVPAYPWLWGGHDEFLHHKRRYAYAELCAKAAAAGLEIEKISYFNTLLFPLVAIVRLVERWRHSPAAAGSDIPPEPINRLLQWVFSAERLLVPHCNLPFGLSLLAVMRAGRADAEDSSNI